MSEFLPEPRPPRRIEARQEQPAAVVMDDLDQSNMRPWCRTCRNPVEHFSYTRCDGGFRFNVACHGEQMDGLIPTLAPHYGLVLEVFCDSDPKVREGRWFWVGCDGCPVQYPRRYNIETAVPGAFSGSFGKFVRKHGDVIGLVPVLMMLFLTVLWKLR